MELISSIVVEMMFCPVLAVICENVDNELLLMDIPNCELYGFHTVKLESMVAAMVVLASAVDVESTVGAVVVAESIVAAVGT